MTFQQEASSWFSGAPSLTIAPLPTHGAPAPSTSKLPLPSPNGKPTIVTFLRHCGCPFAEHTFSRLSEAAKSNPEINFVAVSHSNQDATDKWLASLPDEHQNLSNLKVIVDDGQELYAAWGLGVSTLWHVLSPGSMWSVYTLGKEKGIWNRPTESGSRWQRAGSWAVDGGGKVVWGEPAERADDVADFTGALEALKGK